MSKIIGVTGGTGYIGSYIIRDLLEAGFNVRALVRTGSSKLGYLNQLGDQFGSERIEIRNADLESANYTALLDGCYGVIHTATPYIYTAPDPERDIVIPAINGTLNLLKACSQIKSIRRVLLTGSAGAVINSFNGELQAKDEYDESDWNTECSVTNVPYFYSKVRSEQEAWKYYKENNDNPTSNHFEMVVMLPTFILGPPLNAEFNSSLKLYTNLLFASQQPLHSRVGLCDVRDVSKAHVLALQSTSENIVGNRVIICTQPIEWKNIIERTLSLFPDVSNFNPLKDIPPTKVKDWKMNTSRVKSMGLQYHNLNDTLIDTINQLSKFNLIKLEFDNNKNNS